MKKTLCVLIFCSIFFLVGFSNSAKSEEISNMQPWLIFKNAVNQYKEENFEEALQLFKKLETIKPSTVVYYYLGLCYKETGEYEKAKNYFLKAVTNKPPVFDAYIELINIYYQLGELKKAEEWIKKAEALKIFPDKITFLKGLVLKKEGKFDQAIKAFKKAEALNPKVKPAAEFQIALIYLSQRNLSQAKRILLNIAKSSPAPNIKSFVKDYLALIEHIEKEYRTFRGKVSWGLGYDSNVVLKPSEEVGLSTVDQISHKSDWSQQVTLEMTYSPWLKKPYYFNAKVDLSGKDYFYRNTYSYIAQHIQLTPGFFFKKGLVYLPMDAFYTFVYHNAYSFVWSLTPTVNLVYAPNVIQIGFSYKKRDILHYPSGMDPAEDRDADIYSVFFSFNRAIKKNKGLVFTQVGYTKEDTEGDNWKSHSYKLGCGIILPLIKKLRLIGTFNYSRIEFEKNNVITVENANRLASGLPVIPGFPITPTKRKDDVYSVSAGINYSCLLWNTNLNLTLGYTKDDSNFKIYTYDKYTVVIELEKNF